IDVEVAFERKSVHLLAALLPDASQRKQRARERRAEFLGEFASRRGLWVFASHALALGNRPGSGILVPPERAAGMHQQHQEISVLTLEHENAGAFCCHCFHRSFSLVKHTLLRPQSRYTLVTAATPRGVDRFVSWLPDWLVAALMLALAAIGALLV